MSNLQKKPSKSSLFDNEIESNLPESFNRIQLDSQNNLTVQGSDSSSKKSNVKERQKVKFEEEDPLSKVNQSASPEQIIKKENLSIRLEDETRIVASLYSATKKQASGTLYSIIVDMTKSGALDIGVKDLADNTLAVSMLKRENNKPGAGEEAGIRLGDIIFGINFIPAREGSSTLISIIKNELEKKKKYIHIQGWRCHQLCSDSVPGYKFPQANEMFIQGFSLYKSKVFNDWERWNFIEVLLGHMVEDLRWRSENNIELNNSKQKYFRVLDLEKNILLAKGLRTALNIRIVHTRNKEDTVVYVIRVEDIECGLHWTTAKRFNEFYSLYEELNEKCHYIRDIDFPRKRLTLRNSARLVENRIIMLEQYLRKALHQLTLYSTMDANASQALRHLQTFLGVNKYINCIHPPFVDDQRVIEMMTYRFLNDFNSPASQQCVRFVASVDLESMIDSGEDGFRSLLTFLRDALAEVEQFVQQQHEQQLLQTLKQRRPDGNLELHQKLVKQSIRRQVESALYLPLRRSVFRLLSNLLEKRIKKLQNAILLLQHAKPSVFMVDMNIQLSATLPKAIQAIRKSLLAYLPADQGQFLVEAATLIANIYTECKDISKGIPESCNELDGVESLQSDGIIPILPKKKISDIFQRRHSLSSLPEKTPVSAHPSFRRNSLNLSGNDNSNPKRRHSLKDRIMIFKEFPSHPSIIESDEENDESKIEDVVEARTFSSGTLVDENRARSSEIHPLEYVPPSGTLTKSISIAEKQKMDFEALESLLDNQRNLENDEFSSFDSLKNKHRSLPNTDSNSLKSLFSSIKETDVSLSVNILSPALMKPRPLSTNNISNFESDEKNQRKSIKLPNPQSREEVDIDPLLRPPEEFYPDYEGEVDKQIFAEVFDRHSEQMRASFIDSAFDDFEENVVKNAISADDFLPLFTYVIVHAGVPKLFLLKELMITLISNEDAYGECGYYLATLEAAIQHILNLAEQYEDIVQEDGFFDEEEDFDP